MEHASVHNLKQYQTFTQELATASVALAELNRSGAMAKTDIHAPSQRTRQSLENAVRIASMALQYYTNRMENSVHGAFASQFGSASACRSVSETAGA